MDGLIPERFGQFVRLTTLVLGGRVRHSDAGVGFVWRA